MGFGKKWKRFAGSIGKSVSDLTGSEFAGRATSFAVGGGGLTEAAGGLIGGGGGLSGYSDVERRQTRAKNAMVEAQRLQDIEAKKNADIAEQARLKLLAEGDLQRQLEEEKKRTTFAGASVQSLQERRRLLGV